MFMSEGFGGFERARQANRRGNPLDIQNARTKNWLSNLKVTVEVPNPERLAEIPAALVPDTDRHVEGIFEFVDGLTLLNSGKKLPAINTGALATKYESVRDNDFLSLYPRAVARRAFRALCRRAF